MVLVVHAISHVFESMSKSQGGYLSLVVHSIHEFYRVKTWHEMKDFVLLRCGTYFIEDNTIQYSTVEIIYHNILHPLFTPDPCDYSTRGLPAFKEKSERI